MKQITGPVVPTEAVLTALQQSRECQRQLLIPGTTLNFSAVCRTLREAADNECFIAVSDLAESSLSRQICDATEGIREEYFSFLRKRCHQCRELGIPEFSLDFDLSRVLNDPQSCRNLRRVLRSICGMLEEFQLRLLLTLVLPLSPELAATAVEFRRSLLCGRIGFLLVWYPEECRRREYSQLPEELKLYCDRWFIAPPPPFEEPVGAEELKPVLQSAGNFCCPPRRIWLAPGRTLPELP